MKRLSKPDMSGELLLVLLIVALVVLALLVRH